MYVDEYKGFRIGNIVQVVGAIGDVQFRPNETYKIVEIEINSRPDYEICLEGTGLDTGLETRHGHLPNTRWINIDRIQKVNSGKCSGCINDCNTGEGCPFYQKV